MVPNPHYSSLFRANLRNGHSSTALLESLISVDSKGLVLGLNEAAEGVTGWKNEEAVGMSLQDVFVTENPSIIAFFELTKQSISGASILIDTTRVTTKTGSYRWVEGKAIDLASLSGAGNVLILFSEIAYEPAEYPIFAGTQNLAQLVIDSMHLPLLLLNSDRSVAAANRAFYKTFGITVNECVNVKFEALGSGQWAKIDVDGLFDNLLVGKNGNESCIVEDHFPLLGKRAMRITASSLRLPNCTNEPTLLTIEDISRQHFAERVIKESELRYRRLFETAQDGILILDAVTLVIIDANRYIADLLDYSHGSLIGKELWEIGFFADKAESQATYARLQQFGYVRYDSLPLKTSDGKAAQVEFISNVYSVDGQPIAQCNIRDISERVHTQDILKQQATALTEQHRKKDEFLAMLSHELRNPLAPITNAVRLLCRQDVKNETIQRACLIIERQLVQLTRLVDDLVEVSRITTGRVRLRTERVTIQEILINAIETTQPLIDQRNHTLSVSFGERQIWIDGDPSRLEQAMVNLLANAAKYTDEGGTIALSVSLSEGNCVVRLRDSGVGIAPELLPHIYELFTQAERSLARSRGGLGIGLALVRRIVEMHDGKIDVHSVLNEGTEFVITLPVASSTALPPLPNHHPVPQTTDTLRVLVVDDNEDTAESMAMLVGMLGHEVKTEHDGLSALHTASKYRPDVILLDIGLPGLNGYEVAARIRQQPSLESMVLIAITGYGHESDRQLGLKAGIDHYLVKPVDFDRVRRILATVVDKTSPSSRLAP